MSFRDNLREAIDYCGLEQKELSYLSKIPLRSIESYLRKNSSIPSADKAVKIAQILGVTVEFLVTGKKPPAGTSAVTDPEIQKLIRNIKKLPKASQRIVIKNATNLVEILKVVTDIAPQ
ncbi:MAG: helix-turn-helix domain-containing protein [Treponema sp.]|nr:helix-turn-helix domain-containing protein [Treponema sp.]